MNQDMKLSHLYIEMAEWWMLPPNKTGDDSLWHIQTSRITDQLVYPAYMQALIFLAKQYAQNEARAYLCLLEAEFQKDLEEQEAHNFDLDSDMQ